MNTGKNVDRDEENHRKGKKLREERAMYRREVEAEKIQGGSAAGNEDEKSALNLPMPL